jgi:hypothetical protein
MNKTITLEELRKAWQKCYGEDLAEQYEGLWLAIGGEPQGEDE